MGFKVWYLNCINQRLRRLKYANRKLFDASMVLFNHRDSFGTVELSKKISKLRKEIISEIEKETLVDRCRVCRCKKEKCKCVINELEE